MVRCERAALILFLRYVRDRIYEKCKNSRDVLNCVINELEVLKDDIESKAVRDVEIEIYG